MWSSLDESSYVEQRMRLSSLGDSVIEWLSCNAFTS